MFRCCLFPGQSLVVFLAVVHASQATDWANPNPGSLPEYINELAFDASDQPNSRVMCTEGNSYARGIVANHLRRLKLLPLGDNGDYVYQVLPSSTNCTAGMANVVGYVQGSEIPDEYVLYISHIDGVDRPNSTNVYDDASAVAVGMALAKEFIERPPKRSIIFFFSDGEEEGFLGFGSWFANPTINLSKIKLIFSADPLGASGIDGHDMVAAMGAETTPGLQELLSSAWPQGKEHTQLIFTNRHYMQYNGHDGDVATKYYQCSGPPETCLANGGIPTIWLAQAGYQQYHGGTESSLITPKLQALATAVGKDLSTEPYYVALDTRCALDMQALQKFYISFLPALRQVADDVNTVGSLTYDNSTYVEIIENGWTLQDAVNAKTGYDYLLEALASGPEITHLSQNVINTFTSISTLMSRILGQIIPAYGSANPRSGVDEERS
jgi:hypothetical protein